MPERRLREIAARCHELAEQAGDSVDRERLLRTARTFVDIADEEAAGHAYRPVGVISHQRTPGSNR